MPIQPIKIPQNVNREDQIVGPITLRQIIISLVSMGFSYALWAGGMKDQGLVGFLIAWTPTVLGVAFAFVQINGISLTRFIFLMIEKLEKPATRRFEPRRGVVINIQTVNLKSTEKEKEEKENDQPHGFEELSSVLDQGPLKSKQETEHKTPVDPTKVSANALESSIDEIQPRKELHTPSDAPLINDIYPAPQHG